MEKIKEKLIVHPERCKGCHYCIAACRKEALYVSDFTNKKGYRAVASDPDKCVACGACFAVCPDYVFELVKGDAA